MIERATMAGGREKGFHGRSWPFCGAVHGGARGSNRLSRAGRQRQAGTGSLETRPRRRAPRPSPKVLYSRGTPGIVSRSQSTAKWTRRYVQQDMKPGKALGPPIADEAQIPGKGPLREFRGSAIIPHRFWLKIYPSRGASARAIVAQQYSVVGMDLSHVGNSA